MSFSIKLTPESEKKISMLARAGKIDLRPILKVVGIGYRKEVAMIFGHEQPRGEGMRWPQLSEKYAEWKEKHYPGMPILQRSGRLFNSMTKQGSDGNITVIGKEGAVFGTSISYGIYHDSTKSRSGKLPMRNFSEVSERRKQIWMDQIERSIIQNFKDNGISVSGEILQ